MGMVKFGQLTLNVADIPDGHIVIPEQQYQQLKGAENQYLTLKSSIPYGVDMSQLPTIVDKGSRFDTTVNELNTVKQQLGAATQKLQGFSNLPADFSLDEYKALKQDQAMYKRGQQMEDLFAKTSKFVEETYHVKMPNVDLRFVDDAELDAIDPNAADAPAKMALVFNKAHTAQQEFVAKFGGVTRTGDSTVAHGAPANPNLRFQPPASLRDVRPLGDIVDESHMVIQRL